MLIDIDVNLSADEIKKKLGCKKVLKEGVDFSAITYYLDDVDFILSTVRPEDEEEISKLSAKDKLGIIEGTFDNNVVIYECIKDQIAYEYDWRKEEGLLEYDNNTENIKISPKKKTNSR